MGLKRFLLCFAVALSLLGQQGVAHISMSADVPPILKGFKRYQAVEFVEDHARFLVYMPGFQRCYFAKIPSAEVVKRVKAHLDPTLWRRENGFDAINGTKRTYWYGRPGTIYHDWCVGVQWDTSRPESLLYSDFVIVGTMNKGWTSISVNTLARREDLPRIRELFQYTFGVP